MILLELTRPLQLLSLAFDQSCVDTWGAGTIEAKILCTTDYAAIDTASWHGEDPFNAAPVRAVIAAQSTGGVHKQVANPDNQIPEPVGYDPAVGISEYNRQLDEYIAEVSSSRS